jgi:hypothetical protein
MIQNNATTMAQASAIMLQAVTAITTSHQEAQEAPKEPEVYNMTSNLFPCVCVAMYDTILSPQDFEERLNEDPDNEFSYCTVDWDDWKKALTEAAQDYINDSVIDYLRDYGVISIEADSIWSPKYYNFHQDELNMTISMQQGWQQIMAQKVAEWQNNEAVKKYISTYWHSYDGYINFMPETLAEVLTEDDEDRQLAAYLTLALLVQNQLYSASEIMEDLYYRMDDFSDYQSANVIDEHYDCEADGWELQKLWNNDTAWNQLYWDLAHTIGFKWLHEADSDELQGIADPCTRYQADSDGKRLLFWAVNHQYTVDDLRGMAGMSDN